jgi:methyl-accepting chemotaxis protein
LKPEIARLRGLADVLAASMRDRDEALVQTFSDDINAPTEQIASNVRQAAEATAQVCANIANVSQGAGETEVASSAVLASARSLSSESVRLKSEVEKFLAMVRAA